MMVAAKDRGIVWSDDFLIGIAEIDFEHRRLVEDVNRLHRQLLDEVGPRRIARTLGTIHARMQAHFALEEHVMLSNGYPHYPEHKAEHERLLDEYTELMTKFEREPSRADREAMEGKLRQWIVGHIATSDKKMSLMLISGKQT
ncbi:MAG: bacteriohemerythrin [Hyphomicrobiales bacterium]|nr:bacteriohemerythrin [Hyphomicrobiales bacterium]